MHRQNQMSIQNRYKFYETRRGLRLTLRTIITLFLTSSTTFAAFEINDFGTRSLGLGRAYTAMAGDGEALSYNIAGLARTPKNLAFSSYSNLFGGMNEGSLNHYSAGAIYDGIPLLGRLGAGISVFATQGYQEIQIPVGVCYELPYGIAAGVAIRGLYWSMTPDTDPETGILDKGLSKFTFTADAGLYYDKELSSIHWPFGLNPVGKIAAGFAIKNLIPVSVAVDKNQTDSGRLPVQSRAGLAWLGPKGAVSADYLLFSGGQLRMGGELKALDITNHLGQTEILIRVGTATKTDKGGDENTFGFGLHFNQFRLDAAYIWSQSILDAGATQRYSLSYEF